MTQRISLRELRSEAAQAAGQVLEPRDPLPAVERLEQLGMHSATSWSLGAGLWQIWGQIHRECLRPGSAEGPAIAREAALDLLEAIGEESEERSYCEHWIGDAGTSRPP